MVRLSRRHFLRNSLAAAALAGCGAASVRDGDGSPITPGDPDAGVYFRRPAWTDVLGWQRAMLEPRYWGLA